MRARSDYKKIQVGSISSTTENQKILKQLFNRKNTTKPVQNLINSIDTKIKEPRF